MKRRPPKQRHHHRPWTPPRARPDELLQNNWSHNESAASHSSRPGISFVAQCSAIPRQAAVSKSVSKADIMKQHGEDFKALFAKQMEGAAERLQDSAFVQQAMEAGIAAQQGDTSLLELLKKQESAREAATLRPQLEKLWADFDADGSGVLDPSECGKFLSAFLTAAKEASSEQLSSGIKEQVCSAVNQLVGLLLQMAGLENEEEVKTIQEQVSAMLAELLDLIVPLIQEAIAGLYDSILKDKDAVVPAFVAALDLDNDGRVEKEEFLSTMSTAMDAATNLEQRQQEIVIQVAPKIELAVQGLVQKLAAKLEGGGAAAAEAEAEAE